MNKKAFTVVHMIIALVAVFVFLIISATVANAGDKESASDCSAQATYTATRFTFYAGDCAGGCIGILGAGHAFDANEYGIKINGVNVLHDSPKYAPKDPTLSKIFREVSQDPLLKTDNTEPTFIEYKDPDFGWVKIVARVTDSKIFQSQGTVINVIPKAGPEFKAIIGDAGMTPADDCTDLTTCASLDLLMTTEDKDLNHKAIVDGLQLKGSTIEILRYGPEGEANCSEGAVDAVNANATSGTCYRGSKALDYSFNAWELTSSERSCLGNAKLNISSPRTAAAVVAAADWLMSRPKVPYSMACRSGGDGGWNNNWGESCGGSYNGNYYPYKGLDCSSFVSWAHTTAGFSGIRDQSTATLIGSSKFNTVTDRNPQPGDILVKGSAHTVLITKVYSSTKVDITETGTWNASSSSARSVHRHTKVSLTYSGSKVYKSGDSRDYTLRRART